MQAYIVIHETRVISGKAIFSKTKYNKQKS